MARLVARIKILPADSETDIEVLADTLKKNVPQGMELKAHAKTPLLLLWDIRRICYLNTV